MSVFNPGNKEPCTKLWAILSVDKVGNEGICVINVPVLGLQVAVTSSPKVLEYYKKEISHPAAMAEVESVGMRIVIGEFTRSETRDLAWTPT